MFAAAFGNAAVVEYILRAANVQVDRVDDTGKSALHHACRRECLQTEDQIMQWWVITYLLRAETDIDMRDEKGRTPLMYAVSSYQTDAVQMLLKAGADFKTTDSVCCTAWNYARDMYMIKFLEAVIEEGRGRNSSMDEAAGEEPEAEPKADDASVGSSASTYADDDDQDTSQLSESSAELKADEVSPLCNSLRLSMMAVRYCRIAKKFKQAHASLRQTPSSCELEAVVPLLITC
jgi:ankyrin repeat protein